MTTIPPTRTNLAAQFREMREQLESWAEQEEARRRAGRRHLTVVPSLPDAPSVDGALVLTADNGPIQPATSDEPAPRPFDWLPFATDQGPAWIDYWTGDRPARADVTNWVADRLVLVDDDAFELLPAPARSCLRFGSFGARSGVLTSTMHPCGEPTCRPCAVRWAGRRLVFLAVAFHGLDSVWVYEAVRRPKLGTLTRSIRRRGGQYLAVHRDDADEHVVFSSVAPARGWTADQLDATAAWLRAREAFRLPFLPDAIGHRHSGPWGPPGGPGRDVTYGSGFDRHELDAVTAECETHALNELGVHFDRLSPGVQAHVARIVQRDMFDRPW